MKEKLIFTIGEVKTPNMPKGYIPSEMYNGKMRLVSGFRLGLLFIAMYHDILHENETIIAYAYYTGKVIGWSQHSCKISRSPYSFREIKLAGRKLAKEVWGEVFS